MSNSLPEVSLGAFPFPDDNIDPKLKEEKQFNYEIALAIWRNNPAYGSNLFYNDRVNYERLVKYALGKQSEEIYKPFLGLQPNVNDKTWTKAVNFQIKNYATKRVNIAVSKILSHDYDIEVNSIDQLSVDAREDMDARLKLFLDYKKWFDTIAQAAGVQTSPEGVDPAVLPANRADLDLFMELDYKTVEEIGMELGIKHHINRNKYKSIRHQNAFNSFVLGISAVYQGMDENVLPYVETVHPSELIVPYFRSPDDELPYAAQLKAYTVQEFKKMATGYLSEEEIQDVIKNHCRKPSQNVTYTEDLKNYDDVGKIFILKYNYRSTDTMVKVSQKDDFGNKKLYDKPFDYYASPKEAKKFYDKYGNKRKLYRETYNAVYEGFWVLNSKYVFRYGRRAFSPRKRGNFSEDLMGFKIYAPSAWNGQLVSTGQQMVPCLDELQRYNLKIQQLVARAIPKGVGVDLYALRKANLKWDNKELSDQQKIEMFVRSGIFVFDSKDRYAPGSNYKPFYEVENGLAKDIEYYLRLTQQALYDLDEVIGLTRPTAASSLPAGEGKGTTELQIAATDVALEFLFASDHKIYEEVVESMGMLHVQSVRYGPTGYYDRIFGKLKTGVSYSNVRFDKCDYGFNIKLRPKDTEWDKLYLQAEKAYDKGIIRFSDILLLHEIESLKQARRYLIMLEAKHAREQSQTSAQLQQQNNESQEQSIEAKAKADAGNIKLKHDLALQLEEEKRQTLQLSHELDLERDIRTTRLSGEIDKGLVKDQGTQDRLTAAVQGAIDRQIAAITAKQKAKKAA